MDILVLHPLICYFGARVIKAVERSFTYFFLNRYILITVLCGELVFVPFIGLIHKMTRMVSAKRNLKFI